MADWFPVVSQVKSLVQVTFGDCEGARKTQERFIRQCPVISQVTSAVQASRGDCDSAKRTQLEFLDAIGSVVDSVPLVGHAKGGIHYAVGDKNRGDTAMKASSHSSAVIAGGVGGFLAGGPVGAVLGGMAAGTAMDGIITLSEYKISRQYKPEGIFRPLADPKNPGKWVEGVVGIAVDGLLGKGGGTAVTRAQLKPSIMHIAIPDEKRIAAENLLRLAAQSAAGAACTTFATKTGELFGNKLCAKLKMDEFRNNNNEMQLSQLYENKSHYKLLD